MKYVLIIIDGLGDDPVPELDGKTPLEAAFVPHIYYLASKGRIGRIRTTFKGFPIESMVCIMGLLGYDPREYYPGGRSSFEAMAKGIPLNKDDLIFRCNIVSLDKNKQAITDFTAGMISDSYGRNIISKIELPYNNWELYPGQSYRNILIIRGMDIKTDSIKCFEPHMHIGKSLEDIMPKTKDKKAAPVVENLRKFLMDSQKQIGLMDIPEDCKADMLWVWSPSVKPLWPSFYKRTGLKAAVVGGLDFLHGIAMAGNMYFDVILNATGYIDTDYRAKAQYAIKYLKKFDFVTVHINAADEEAHRRNHNGKIEAIEKVDHYIIEPVLYELHREYKDDFRIVVCGDHYTRCSDGKHTDDAVPYAIYGKNINPSYSKDFGERSCEEFEPILSLRFFEEVFRGGIK